MSATPRSVAVYAEVDPNLVDGSSVWLQSICEVLASIGDVEVTLLLRRPLELDRRFLFYALETHDRVEFVDSGQPSLLDAEGALDLLEGMDRDRGPFDLVVLRGQGVLNEAARRRSFEGRLWAYAMTGRGMPDETLRALGSLSARLLCQTEAVAKELREIAPAANRSILVLPPMIPDFDPPAERDIAGTPMRLVYSGKLAPEYCWLETVEAFNSLRQERPDAELRVLGDKIHRPVDDPDFHEEAMRTLLGTEGLRWQGAVPRVAVLGLLAECDLALSIRDPAVEAAREISTKVLEYGAAGLPVVLNRAPAYERLLGEGYPLFIDGPNSAADLLTGAALDPQVRKSAAAACHAASRDFTFDRIAARLSEHMPQKAFGQVALSPPNVSTPRTASATRVLIAGHDLKFVGPIGEAVVTSGAILTEDVWRGHTEHDEAASRAALDGADTVLCEWCLGNAAWYSRNKRPDQRLVIRLHRVEAYTDHPAAVEIDNVDRVVCVSQHIADEVIERFGWDRAKITVIPNSVDVDRFYLPKREGAHHVLAMVGYVPRRKRLDRALDVIECLRREDTRFRLLLIGHPPSELDWVGRDPEEVEFFRNCYRRIAASDELRGAVGFHPHTDDLPSFFQQAGFVLSASESEGHQVALAEGAASGAIPVILARPGAKAYPDRFVHANVADAAAAVLTGVRSQRLRADADLAAKCAAAWSPERIQPQWVSVLGLHSSGADDAGRFVRTGPK